MKARFGLERGSRTLWSLGIEGLQLSRDRARGHFNAIAAEFHGLVDLAAHRRCDKVDCDGREVICGGGHEGQLFGAFGARRCSSPSTKSAWQVTGNLEDQRSVQRVLTAQADHGGDLEGMMHGIQGDMPFLSSWGRGAGFGESREDLLHYGSEKGKFRNVPAGEAPDGA